MELAALERMKKAHRLIWGKRCHHIFSAIFAWILFIFAGNEDMHKSFNEFKFGQMRPLVSMLTDRVIVGKTASSRFLERF